MFRSRIEARWAVVFDALELRWAYEADGFDLVVGGSRVSYLPDFYLPDVWGQSGQGIWFEVKGAAPNAREKALAQSLAKATGHDCYIGSGDIPAPAQLTGARVLLSPGRIDGFHPRARRGIEGSGKPTSAECLCVCECGAVGMQRNGLIARMQCSTPGCGRKTLAATARKGRATPRVQAALVAGRSARFEHGESGATITAPPSSPRSTPSVDRLERIQQLLSEAAELLADERAERR